MKTVALHTLGCKLNFAETSSIGRQFRDRGYRIVDAAEPSDVFVLNTCSVTERADRECRQLIRRVRRASPQTYVIVTGCYAQLRPEAIAAIDGVDLILGANEKFEVFDLADPAFRKGTPGIHVSPIAESKSIIAASSAGTDDRTRSFLKIQDGCDYSCTFCTIPLARGSSRSLPAEDVLAEARKIAGQGFREIVLTGVNVGDYGRKSGASLLSLLKMLTTVDGIERIRVSSIEPNLLTDELLEFWLSEPKLCRHFHIPLQSGSNEVLNRMRRRYRTGAYEQRVLHIRSLCPDAGIGADVLVGFPGESAGLFEEAYAFIRDLPLSYFHVFTYSERPHTPAVGFAGIVEPRIRAERSERLRMLGLRKRRQFNGRFVGTTQKVLFERSVRPGVWSGLTDHYIRVAAESDVPVTNQILPVRITGADNEQCGGEIVCEEHERMSEVLTHH